LIVIAVFCKIVGVLKNGSTVAHGVDVSKKSENT